MNLMKRMFGAWCLFLGMAALPVWEAKAVVGGTGDIYRFEQTTAYSEGTPATVGKTIGLKMTLINEGVAENAMTANYFEFVPNFENTTAANDWAWLSRYISDPVALTNAVKDAMLQAGTKMPKLGIMVSGELRFAEINPVANGRTTELNMEYTVKAGDYAFPFSPANSSGEFPSNRTVFDGYFVTNLATSASDTVNPWFLKNAEGSIANLSWHGGTDPAMMNQVTYLADYYLDNNGSPIVIEGIAYSDAVSHDTANIWREIYEGTTDTYEAVQPSVEVVGGLDPADATTLYVWVDPDDTDAVILDPAQATIHNHNGNDVLYLTIAGAETKFSLKGVSQTATTGASAEYGAGTARIYISQFPTNRTDAQSVLMNEKLMRVVKVIEPPEPTIRARINGSDTATITATSDYRTAQATVTVSLSEAPAADTTVRVTATINNTAAKPVEQYIGLATTTAGNSYQLFQQDLVFPAGEIDSKTLNVFVMNADQYTQGDGITFTVEDVSATPAYTPETLAGYSLYINPIRPEITTPAEGAIVPGEYEILSQVPIEIEIDDTHYNATNVYKVGFAGGTLSATEYVAVNGVITITPTFSTIGENDCRIVVTNATGYASSPVRTLKVLTKAAKTVQLVHTEEDGTVIEETAHRYGENADDSTSEPVFIMPVLSETAGSAVYAFLVPGSEAATNAIYEAGGETFLEKFPPQLIQPGSTTAINPFSLRFLDGNGNDTAGLPYSVVLRTEASEAAAVNSSFTAMTFYATVTNVWPKATAATISPEGGTADTATPVNAAGLTKVTINSTKEFRVGGIFEPSFKDLENPAFATRWQVLDEEGTVLTTYLQYGDPTAAGATPFVYNFATAGTNKVVVAMRDGDMRNTQWGEEFSFDVAVAESPYIALRTAYTGNRVPENASRATVTVELSEAAKTALTVELEIKPVNATSTNPGDAELSATTVTIPANRTSPSSSPYLINMYGTPVSETDGFTVTAKVTTDAENADGVKYSDLYTPVEEGDFYLFVTEVAPVETRAFSIIATTNTVNIGAAQAFDWRIEFANQTKRDEGATLVFASSGTPASLSVDITPTGATDDSTTITGTTANSISGRTMFTFNSSGIHYSSLQELIYGPTGEKQSVALPSRVKYYQIEAAKIVKLYAVGPGNGITDFEANNDYRRAAGIGAGYVYSDGGGYSGFKAFCGKWSYAVTETGADVYAQGYKVGDVHNAALNPALASDLGIDTKGNSEANKAPATFYQYTDAEKDSFFYCWLQNDVSAGTVGTAGSYVDPVVAPQIEPDAVYLNAKIKQVDSAGGGGSQSQQLAAQYAEKEVAAVFSKEYIASDNLGDINQDGIPDVFARTKTWFGDNDVLTTLAADLDDLATLNDDEDLLPAVTFGTNKAGRTIIPSLTAGWDTAGEEFDALWELRGYGAGLNSTTATGVMVSDIDMTDDEWVAFVRANPGVADEVVDADGNIVEDEKLNFQTNNADYATKIAAVKNVLMTTWTPENATRATLADTDGDGLPDGWEYFFWYHATVHDLHGRRFSLEDPTYGSAITPEEIIEVYNPNARNREILLADLDSDGLMDLEELAIGTNPVDWDTDGDYMPDGWEVMWGINPLSNHTLPYNTYNPDGDFYAKCDYNESAEYTMVHKNGEGWVAISGDAPDTSTAGSASGIAVIWNPAHDYFFPAGCLNDMSNGAAPEFVDKVIEWTDEELEAAAARGDKLVETADAKYKLTFIHQQVRKYKGYDPRTGWMRTPSGLVHLRWGGIGETGTAVDTEAFDMYDEFILYKYLLDVEERGASLHTANTGRMAARRMDSHNTSLDDIFGTGYNAWRFFLDYCTCPVPDWYVSESDTESESDVKQYIASLLSALSENGTENATFKVDHGADTNGDGVPDGWALYVGRNATIPIDLADLDPTKFDADGLTLPAEYAGTDSCAAYINVPSISNKWNSAWVNKFWPTDPDDADTDADGITDGAEGGSFSRVLYFGTVEHHMISSAAYGSGHETMPSGGTCYRGGGLNPCTIDTDVDGLPDPWEVQFIGVPMTADGQWWSPVANNSSLNTELLPDSFWVANGMKNPKLSGTEDYSTTSSDSSEGTSYYMMTMGMDQTDGTDAGTQSSGRNGVIYGQSIMVRRGEDTIANFVRDLDFDGDGLQNFQEYLVQALRHLRYDDDRTPLMGKILADGAIESNGAPFVTFDSYDEDLYKKLIADRYNLGDEVLDAIDYRSLGYFATAPRLWDRANQGHSDPWKYMLPPSGSGGYVSTDPSMVDTDFDGMDDYYELFHGLNPIYGQDPSGVNLTLIAHDDTFFTRDVISEAYSTSISAVNNAWTAAKSGFKAGDYNPGFFPWLNGSPFCDADLDGLNNYEESIKANLGTPANTHTDPTPQWFTDPSGLKLRLSYDGLYYISENSSYTAQYYVIPSGLSTFWPWSMANAAVRLVDPETDTIVSSSVGTMDGSSGVFMFAFEANEGFDTDGDWRSDLREQMQNVEGASDPLVFMDLNRRQAAYFPGENSAIVTREPGHRAIENYDMFRTFTVECWVRPEARKESVILERATWVSPESIVNSEGQMRANFRIGVDADGYPYGLVESVAATQSDSDETSKRVTSSVKLEEGKWTHLALSYDGSALVLYRNGMKVKEENCHLIPANGVPLIVQSTAHTYDFPADDWEYYNCGLVVGAKAKTAAAIALDENTAWSDYDEFFNGYVDEIRIWDGARTANEIRTDYTKRYSFEDVAAQREEVFAAWNGGKRRTEGTLPVELVQHYNFSTLPGAINGEDVMQTPSGFEQGVAAGTGDATIDLDVAWWKALDANNVASTVYKDRRVVPWVQNTLLHLPAMDGSARDSMFWGSNIAGFQAPIFLGAASYEFPNTANPYGWSNFISDRYYQWSKLSRMAQMRSETITGIDYTNLVERFRYQLRADFVGVSDMVALGGAFAKRCEESWDGEGAFDAWADTKTDSNGDGLPDWWVEIAKGYGLDVEDGKAAINAMVDYDGGGITAAQAYRYDLARGMLPDGYVDKTFIDTVDTDRNSLPDWWETLYGLTDTSGGEDFDGDGLSNRAEYLISEIFGYYRLDPRLPVTPTNEEGDVLDYFKKVGQMYLGEMFDDHDYIENTWEAGYPHLDSNNEKYVDAYVYDPGKDLDNDGWSNWAEARAGTAPVRSAIQGADDDSTGIEYPVPVIEMNLYAEETASDAPIYVKAWSATTLANDRNFDPEPDATWVIQNENDVTERSQYLGMNTHKRMTMNLGPGSVRTGSVRVRAKDLAMICGVLTPNTFKPYSNRQAILSSEQVEWSPVAFDRPRVDGSEYGDLVFSLSLVSSGEDADSDSSDSDNSAKRGQDTVSNEIVICTINYETGEVEFDLERVTGSFYLYWDGSTWYPSADYRGYRGWSSVWFADSDGNVSYVLWDVYAADLDKSYLKLTWKTKRVPGEKIATYYLSYADSGHVREGLNTFEAFIDLDGDGIYTVGSDCYGVANNVEVGYAGGKFGVELSKVSPIIDRFDIASGLTDRGVEFGTESGDYTNLVAGVLSGGTKEIVRLVRTHINEQPVTAFAARFTSNPQGALEALNAVVYERIIDFNKRSVLTERDICENGDLDIDWKYLAELTKEGQPLYTEDITNVLYRVVFGHGTTSATNYNNLARVAIPRMFDGNALRRHPTLLAPASGREGTTVYASHPTFKWTTGIRNNYTAFNLQILDEEGKEVVWDSGTQPLPMCDAEGKYVWEAPVYVGDQVTNNTGKVSVFENLKNYRWRVRVQNAKFRDSPTSTNGFPAVSAKFRMNTNEGIARGENGNGSIAVAVKYRGPEDVYDKYGSDAESLAQKIRVQVYRTPDFTGTPVSQGFVTNITTVTNRTVESNIVLGGIPNGTYYVLAFIDTDGDFKRSATESWGYANLIGDPSVAYIYTPQPVVIDNSTIRAPAVTVWINDTDADGDWLPDAWEITVGPGDDGYTDNGPAKTLDGDELGFFVNVNPELLTVITSRGEALTGASTANFQSAQFSALALGARPKTASAADARAAITAIVSSELEVEGISVTGISVDADGNVHLAVEAEATEAVAAQAARLAAPGGEGVSVAAKTYAATASAGTKTLVYRVLHTERLADEFQVIEEGTIDVTGGTIETDFNIQGQGGVSGFYKVEIDLKK
ncbi:MAG: hypothetical protein IJ802_02430 [Kiritimatiellae bacterium]|nr:hypothetical protein [Kiritimatiellia bacterium]